MQFIALLVLPFLFHKLMTNTKLQAPNNSHPLTNNRDSKSSKVEHEGVSDIPRIHRP